jgi:transposase
LPKTPLDLTALRASQHELEAALAIECRKRVRKRIVAISAILTGKSIPEAAGAANTTRETVERCLDRVRQCGLQSLFRDRRLRRPKWQMTAEQVEQARREIGAALARPLRPEVKTRLLAVDIVLSGRPFEEAMASAQVLRGAVREWLRLAARDGIAPTLARWERKHRPWRPQIDADPAALRELAAKESRRPRRKQLLALALVAEGMTPHAATLAAGANYGSVLRRIRRFREEGVEAFCDRAPFGRRQRLNKDQLSELRTEILQRPDMGYRQLAAFVAAWFGAHYSPQGLRSLLKRELGIISKRRRFTEAAPVAPLLPL